jgi:hypothetical protein
MSAFILHDSIDSFDTYRCDQYMKMSIENISLSQTNLCYSLSCREESYKHKLSDCLLVCPHFTDWSKTNPRIKGIIISKTLTKGNRG